jgi:transcriptional regulator with XRE-family HTH domain
MSSDGRAHVKDKFEEFVANGERRRLFERESLAFDAAELISLLMEEKQVTKAELARRVGKTRGDITQLLNGSRNMTMHTLADLAFALGARIELKARPCPRQQVEKSAAKTHYLYRFAAHCTQNVYSPSAKTVKSGKTGSQSHQLGA